MNKQSAIKPKKLMNFIFLVFFSGLFVLSLANLSLYMKKPPDVIYTKSNPVNEKILFWKSFLDIHPDYFEGWVELSKLEIENGNSINAKEAYINAYRINPNSPELNEIKLELDNISLGE